MIRNEAEFYRKKGAGVDRGRWREDGIHRRRFTVENGYRDSINADFRDELLNGEICTTLPEARILIERWRLHNKKNRPHRASRYKPSAPKSVVPTDQEPCSAP